MQCGTPRDPVDTSPCSMKFHLRGQGPAAVAGSAGDNDVPSHFLEVIATLCSLFLSHDAGVLCCAGLVRRPTLHWTVNNQTLTLDVAIER